MLFWVYASSLRYAELALVTMGWVVMLQVALVLVDRWPYGVELPTGKWVAIGVVLLAQAYLVLAPSATRRAPPPVVAVRLRPRTGALRTDVGATCRRALCAPCGGGAVPECSPRSARTGHHPEGSPCVEVASATPWWRLSAS